MARRSYAQNWEVLTLQNCYSIEPPSYSSTAYVVASFGLVSFLLFRKHLGNLREFFGQIVYRPPWQKIARTPMLRKVKVASRYRAFSSSCDFFIRIVLNFNFGLKVLTHRNKQSEML